MACKNPPESSPLSSQENTPTPQSSNVEDSSRQSGDSSISSGSLVGCRMGDYQILRKLGRGGMADVYAARHLSLARDVAIKVLRSNYARDEDYVSRFRREARAAAKLNHRNIVQVYDVGSVNDTHYIAQELIDGKNLKEVLNSTGTLSTEEAIETLVAVGLALEAAADCGITHRDIKPENIMRSTRGEIKVADFGLARLGVDSDASRADLTQAGLTMGTPRYMSPEQVQGKPVDVRSDLYSLGVTMYHMLAGRPPFESDDPLALAVLHLHETPEPLDRTRGKDDIPEWLIAVVSRLMNKLPSDRFQSPQSLLDAIGSETSTGNDQGYNTVGTAAATIRLQRATDAAIKQRRSKVAKWAMMLALPLLSGVGAATYAMRQPKASISELLRPEKPVETQTVEEQFLAAVSRDDVAAWEAVSEYFPHQDSSTNLAYHAKSLVQLARLHQNKKEYALAEQALNRLLGNAQIDRKYRLVALAKHHALLVAMTADPEVEVESEALEKSRRQLDALYNEVEANNRAAIRFFRDAVPESERLFLEVGTPPKGSTAAASKPFVGNC